MTYILNRLLSIAADAVPHLRDHFRGHCDILPGDVATMIMGTQSNPEALAGLRKSLGLNDPLRRAIWAVDRRHGDGRLGPFARLQGGDRRTARSEDQGERADRRHVDGDRAGLRGAARGLGRCSSRPLAGCRRQQRGARRRQPARLLLGDHDDPSVRADARLVPIERLRRSRGQPRAARSARLPAVARARPRAHGASDAHDALDDDRHSRPGIYPCRPRQGAWRARPSFGATRSPTRSGRS